MKHAETLKLIAAIVDRALAESCHLRDLIGQTPDGRLSLLMDISGTHDNTPLHLDALLAADSCDFLHDVSGIYQYYDREAKQLTDGWTPRYTQLTGE